MTMMIQVVKNNQVIKEYDAKHGIHTAGNGAVTIGTVSSGTVAVFAAGSYDYVEVCDVENENAS